MAVAEEKGEVERVRRRGRENDFHGWVIRVVRRQDVAFVANVFDIFISGTAKN